MFDIGFSELLLIGVVALVVLGPERLPRVARTVGHLLGRAQRYAYQVKSDVRRELDKADLKRFQDEVEETTRSLQENLQTARADFITQLHGNPELSLPPALPAVLAVPDLPPADSASPGHVATPFFPAADNHYFSPPAVDLSEPSLESFEPAVLSHSAYSSYPVPNPSLPSRLPPVMSLNSRIAPADPSLAAKSSLTTVSSQPRNDEPAS